MFKPFQIIMFNTINTVNWLVFSERFLYTVNLYTLSQNLPAKSFCFHRSLSLQAGQVGIQIWKNQIFAPLFLPLVGDNPKPHKLKYFLQN